MAEARQKSENCCKHYIVLFPVWCWFARLGLSWTKISSSETKKIWHHSFSAVGSCKSTNFFSGNELAINTQTSTNPFYCCKQRSHWRYHFNLSVGVVLNMGFATNGMCAKNGAHIYVTRISNNRVITAHDLCYCSLPQCEPLRTCRSGFPIATTSVKVKSMFILLWQPILS